jgi:hypothetical protein
VSEVESVEVKTIPLKEALLIIFKRFGFNWEDYVDDEENAERVYAAGTVDGIKIRVSCKPNECKTEAPEYRVAAPCYSKPEPAAIVKCVFAVLERVRETEKKAEELLEVAKKLEECGFKVERADNGARAHMFIRDGEIVIDFTSDNSTMRIELKAKTPVKLVIVATELAELFKRLQLL